MLNQAPADAQTLANILTDVRGYYDAKIQTHGPGARGVDWNSEASQQLRFKQLLKICADAGPFTLTDYGCGYGALLAYAAGMDRMILYRGFDVSEQMIMRARELHAGRSRCEFFTDAGQLVPTDYTVASGIFNVRLNHDAASWQAYLLDTLCRLDACSTRGFAFNALTSYSDPPRMRPDLYYADPCVLFHYCKHRFSRNVALLHDYGLYEFTILVTKQEA